MKEVIRYQCEFCKKEFKTPDKHYCKFNPELKNCFSCKHHCGWEDSEDGVDVGIGFIYNPPYPSCNNDGADDWDIETIKQVKYNMQCEKWEQK